MNQPLVLPFRVIQANNEMPPLTYKRFQTILSTMEAPNHPCETLTSKTSGNSNCPVEGDHDDRFSVPTLDELGELRIFNIKKHYFSRQIFSEFHIALSGNLYFIDSFQRAYIFNL